MGCSAQGCAITGGVILFLLVVGSITMSIVGVHMTTDWDIPTEDTGTLQDYFADLVVEKDGTGLEGADTAAETTDAAAETNDANTDEIPKRNLYWQKILGFSGSGVGILAVLIVTGFGLCKVDDKGGIIGIMFLSFFLIIGLGLSGMLNFAAAEAPGCNGAWDMGQWFNFESDQPIAHSDPQGDLTELNKILDNALTEIDAGDNLAINKSHVPYLKSFDTMLDPVSGLEVSDLPNEADAGKLETLQKLGETVDKVLAEAAKTSRRLVDAADYFSSEDYMAMSIGIISLVLLLLLLAFYLSTGSCLWKRPAPPDPEKLHEIIVKNMHLYTIQKIPVNV